MKRFSRRKTSETLDDGGVGHPADLAHRLQPVATPALFERLYQCRHDAGTTSAQRVADGDGAAVDVGARRMSV